jgi:hypothetical protein
VIGLEDPEAELVVFTADHLIEPHEKLAATVLPAQPWLPPGTG